MTPTQVWIAITELLTKLYPDCIVKRMYAPDDDLENIAYSEQPTIWVTLNSAQIASVNTMATYIEDCYDFRLTLIWKIKDDNLIELDKRLDTTQKIISQMQYSSVEVGNSAIFLKQPNVEEVYDGELLTSAGCYVSTIILPVSVYRSLTGEPFRHV